MGKTSYYRQSKGRCRENHDNNQSRGISCCRREKTLIIDADPQANATGLRHRSKINGLVDLRMPCRRLSCGRFAGHTCARTRPVGSRIDLAGAEIELINKPSRENVLKRAVGDVADIYDFILIDCSPSLGLITVNALTAADSVIIPVQAEYFALEGITKLLNTIRIIKSKLNPALEIEGFLLTMYDARLRLANQIYEELKDTPVPMVFDCDSAQHPSERGLEPRAAGTALRSDLARATSHFPRPRTHLPRNQAKASLT